MQERIAVHAWLYVTGQHALSLQLIGAVAGAFYSSAVFC